MKLEPYVEPKTTRAAFIWHITGQKPTYQRQNPFSSKVNFIFENSRLALLAVDRYDSNEDGIKDLFDKFLTLKDAAINLKYSGGQQ